MCCMPIYKYDTIARLVEARWGRVVLQVLLLSEPIVGPVVLSMRDVPLGVRILVCVVISHGRLRAKFGQQDFSHVNRCSQRVR